ncbi:type II secretion system protein E (plasmid) [Thioalkalivibrio sp. K90mix]|uniref:GspE/PulE family protein n=1 Tax=Thioalkalivibrio sp. (strain K90mix) TaxID=396595 RepID=UPI000195A8CF|nr:ATPase, T2SS/T4P/T4SS family [Thioalkalivibrio sp. K90mix]ADC73344.1 type II secretion system protein E [Thioalkalivibrio sp. K90mix]
MQILNRTDGSTQRLGELLIERGLLSSGALDASLTEQRLTGERLGRIMVRNGFVTRKQLLATLADTENPEVLSEPFESDRVPPEVLLELRTMLLGDTGDRLLLASDAPRWWVERVLGPYFPGHRMIWMDFDPEIHARHLELLAAYTSETVLDRLLRRAVMEGISDIHLIPKPAAYTVMYRRLGVRQIIEDRTREEGIRMVAQAKDRAKVDIAETSVPQDGAFRLAMLDRSVDFRVATIPETDGEKLVIRVLDPEAAYPELEALGMREVDTWMDAAAQPHGICLICGATGSGKSTTLNATLRRLDRFGMSIQTVEDPVEHQLSFVGQVEVNRGRGLDFTRALRGFMRADPDVLIVGEIRDRETAELAVQAAETGHMVFATLHTDSAAGGLTRLRDLGVPIADFAPLVRATMAQKLIRVACPHCHGKGCDACEGIGYSGRTLISEVAPFRGPQDVERALNGETWWTSLREDGEARLREGSTTDDEIRRVLGSGL